MSWQTEAMNTANFSRKVTETEYFSSTDGLVDQAEYYSQNDAARDHIASAGRRRCEISKYAYIYRLNDILGTGLVESLNH